MAKNKPHNRVGEPKKAKKAVDAVPVKAASSVIEGRVTKPAQTPQAKSKELAKNVAKAQEKKGKKQKKVKEPTPEPDSDSEAEDSSAESSSESESEVETPGLKANGVAKKAEYSDESSASSDSDNESESEAETPATKTAPKVNGAAKTNGAAAASSKSSASASSGEPAVKEAGLTLAEIDTSGESESDESESDAEDSKATATSAKAGAEASSEEDSEEDSDDESDDSDDSDESKDEDDQPASKKRKADTEVTAAAKKSKTEPTEQHSSNLFIGNLSWNIDEEWLMREFEEFGEIAGCRIVMDKFKGHSKGFGYVDFVNPADAAKALEAKAGKELDGRAMNVDFSAPRTENKQHESPRQRADRFGDQKSPPSETLFIGNISFDATNADIQDAFEPFGTITRVTLPTDQESGNLKGFGYVAFSTIDEAKAAMESMGGADIAGRNIRLDYATARTNDGGNRGFGGRGDRGGRGRGNFGGRGDRGGFGGRGGRGGSRGGPRGGRGFSTNRGGFGDFKGSKMTF